MRREYCIALLLVLLTALVYWPARQFQFTNFDDNDYVTDNYHVREGLTAAGVAWAFTTFTNSNWHPLTWLSHMLDCQLFGVNAGAHHLENVAWHAANAALLFCLLWQLTRATWRSAVVAGLFAWHPMHVESVAWVAERKDVLSTFFWLLAVMAYVRRSKVQEPKSKVFYVLALGAFALGLLAKPMLVTLPFVLLLLDAWPLQTAAEKGQGWARWRGLVVEKAPFFALAAASCVVTFVAQRQGGAIATMSAVPLAERLKEIPVAYAGYLEKFFCPVGLCVLYPFSEHAPLVAVLAAGLLVFVTAIAVRSARTRPYLAVGWFWFLGMLVPVIGLVQVGGQAMADRYSYLPFVGLFIAVVWGVADFAKAFPKLSWMPAALGMATVASCLLMTRRQLPFWHDSVTLFERAVAVAPRNPIALSNLGAALASRGRLEDGVVRLREALAIVPDLAGPRLDLASALALEGNAGEAIQEYREVLRANPDLPEAQNNLALVLATDWRATNRNGAEAVALAQRACELTGYTRPQFLSTLASAEAEAGRFDDAVDASTRAMAAATGAGDTNFAAAENRRLKLYRQNQPFHDTSQLAEQEYEAAEKLNDEGKQFEAMAHYRKALEWNPDKAEALNDLALILATDAAATNRNGTEAVRFAEKACELTQYQRPIFVGTLAEAYAEAGQFDRAVATGNRAADLFDKSGDAALAKLTRDLVELFRSKRPYHEGM